MQTDLADSCVFASFLSIGVWELEARGQFQASALRRQLPGFFLGGSACPHFAHDPRLP